MFWFKKFLEMSSYSLMIMKWLVFLVENMWHSMQKVKMSYFHVGTSSSIYKAKTRYMMKPNILMLLPLAHAFTSKTNTHHSSIISIFLSLVTQTKLISETTKFHSKSTATYIYIYIYIVLRSWQNNIFNKEPRVTWNFAFSHTGCLIILGGMQQWKALLKYILSSTI